MGQPTLHRLEQILAARSETLYPRRGDSDVRGDADKASQYYVNRLWTIYRDASVSAQGLRDRVDGWLRRDDEREEPEPD